MIPLLSDFQVLSGSIMIYGCRILIQSTLLIAFGLFAARMLKHRGAALQSSILRITLVALLLCPWIGSIGNFGSLDIPIPQSSPTYLPDLIQSSLDNSRLLSMSASRRYTSPISSGEINTLSAKDIGVPSEEVIQDSESGTGLLSPKDSLSLETKNVSQNLAIVGTSEMQFQSSRPEQSKVGTALYNLTTIYSALSALWILVTMYLLARLVQGCLRIQHLRLRSIPATRQVILAGQRLAAAIGVPCPPVLMSRQVQSPLLTGLIRSAILLPENYPEAQSSQVLAHELAHVQRRDCFWNIVGRVATALFFFQPLLWMLIRRMEEASEEVCDDYVLHYVSGRQSYARKLVNMAEAFGYCPKTQVAAIGVVNLRSSLGHRVERILDDSRNLSLRTSFRALFALNLLALISILGVSLLGITPAVSAEEAGRKTYELHNELWNLSIQPSTLQVIAKPKQGEKFALSHPISDIGPVKKFKKEGNQISWELPDKGAKVSMKLAGGELIATVQVKDPVIFSWPRLRMNEPVKGLIWPHWEGSYIPMNDQRWVDRLLGWESVDTLEGLGMPFWGLDCGDYSLTYIILNRYNNTIRFSKEEDRLVAEFTHDFPPNHAPREYGFIISLGENKTPVEPAQKFREWLIDQGEFVSMKEKMKKTPKVERLLGAPHIYLWGDAYLSKQNVRSPKNRWTKVWKPFTKQMIEESRSKTPTVGKRIKELLGEKQWTGLIIEMAKVPYDYQYLQKEICLELSRLLGFSDFYQAASWKTVVISDEAKELLARERSTLSLKELARMNGLLFQVAYPDYLAPVDQWGDAVSVQMLKDLKEAGFDRLRICLDGWGGIEKRPEVAVEADKMGYLFGIYDSFHSIHPPQWQGTDSTWPTAQFNQELYDTGGITRRDGTKKKGFKQRGYILSPIAARPYVEERVNRNFNNVPYNYYFVDCDAYGQVFDDYTPGRETTMEEGAMARNDRLAWICDTHDVVIGSEGGCSYSAPVIHIAEGMFLSAFGWGDPDLKDKNSEYFEGGYYPPDGPANFFKPTQLKEKYHYFHYDPRFRLPLYETVFHDSVVATNHWGKGNLKYPEEKDLVFLTQLLYQVPPMYHVNAEEFKKRKDIMKEQYDFFSPLHRDLGFSQMTDFAWLSEDRLVQKTVFDEKVELVANFSSSDFLYEGTSLPGNSLLVRWKDTGTIQINLLG